MRRRADLIAITALLVLTVSGCGSPQAEQLAPGQSSTDIGSEVRDLVKTAPSLNVDSLLAVSPSEVDWNGQGNLAEAYQERPNIRSIVVGTVEGFSSGPLFPATKQDAHPVPTLVMAVRVSQVLKGDVDPNSMVYVQLWGASDARTAADAVPRGSVVGLYLEPAPQVSDPELLVQEPDAGRPDGEPVWLTGAAGLVIANGPDGGVALPRVHALDSKSVFTEYLPGPLLEQPAA